MAVFFGFGCNICYKTDDGSLNDISKENMKHLKDTLITFVGHADIVNYNEIYLCQLCCDELIRFDKFRELCFSHLIQLRQNCFNMLPQLDLEGSEANSNNTLKTFVHQVLRRNSVDTNNCPVSITTEYNEVKSFDDLNESDLDFNELVINLRSQRNECDFVGDCSTGSVINSVIKCDESRVAYMNEEDIKHVMIRRSEDTKLETFDVSNVSDVLQIQFMKEEIDLNGEIESSDPEIFTLTSFENKSGEQVNLDVKEPVVNVSSDSMKEKLHVKQENSHSEGVKLERIDDFGDGVHVAFEIANVCTIVNVGNGGNEDIRNQEGEIGMKLRSRRHNKEEIDVVTIADKQITNGRSCATTLPTNPSIRDRQKLQRRVMLAISSKREFINQMCTGCVVGSGNKTRLPLRLASSGSSPHASTKKRTAALKGQRGAKRARYQKSSPAKRRGYGHSSDIDTECSEKRSRHNNMERQRRLDLCNAFDDLRVLVPGVSCKKRAAKVGILREAAAYCHHLSEESAAYSRQVAELRRQQERLRARVS